MAKFEVGNPGGPGRPRGSRSTLPARLVREGLSEEAAKRVLNRVVDAAESGDLRAAEILFRHMWPKGKSASAQAARPAAPKPWEFPIHRLRRARTMRGLTHVLEDILVSRKRYLARTRRSSEAE